ncbi:MAG: response regulator [Lachnospiraceae bacterium]|nr:response regulator [Lachnospiraceae bacterium]
MKKPYKVMVVEDQSLTREFFSMMIERSEDYELLYSVSSASVAMMYCDRYAMDLIIMDVVMFDGSNGLDEAERIKRSHPEVKIIIVTSMPEVSFLNRTSSIGVEGFWYKEGQSNQDDILKVMDLVM